MKRYIVEGRTLDLAYVTAMGNELLSMNTICSNYDFDTDVKFPIFNGKYQGKYFQKVFNYKVIYRYHHFL